MEESTEPLEFYLIWGVVAAHLAPIRPLSHTLGLGGRKASEVSAGSKEGGEACDGYLPMTPVACLCLGNGDWNLAEVQVPS